MPVEFLSDEQARRYGRFQGDPNPDQLERFFAFGDAELIDISRQRSVGRGAAGQRPHARSNASRICLYATGLRLLPPR
jgi:hypothetical protein